MSVVPVVLAPVPIPAGLVLWVRRSGMLWLWLPAVGLLWVLMIAPVQASGPGAEVLRAGFCLNVTQLEPDAFIEVIGPEADRVLFFSELTGLNGQTVRHRWSAGGTVVLEVPFTIEGDRWRVYSAKQLAAESGALRVEIVLGEQGDGAVLATYDLPVLAAADF